MYENVIPTAQLIASNGAATDQFGWSVGISGNTIVVGAPDATIVVNGFPHQYQGAAYVFVEPTGGWASEPLSTGTTTTEGTQTAELTASGGTAANYFGVSVGISGNTVVVGAQGVAFGSNYFQGAAYVFVEPTNGWVSEPTTTPFGIQTAELSAKDGATTGAANFGHSVSIGGTTANTIVVGAPSATFGSNIDQGAAYVFVEPTNGWAAEPPTTPFGTQTAELTASTGASSASFGYSVGVNASGDTVVAGAQGVGPGSNQGAAYVFVEPTAAGGWASATSENETAELTASDAAALNFFGLSVGIGGSTVVVGAPGPTIGPGAAYVFTQAEPYASFSNTTAGSPSQVTFGNVTENTTATQTVTVTNTGTGPLIIQLVLPEIGTGFSDPQFVCSNGASSASSPPYPITLNSGNPGDSCTFTVQFDPTTLGPLSGTLQFGDNAGAGDSNLTSTVNGSFFTQTVQLSGTGVAPPVATYSPTTLSYGNVTVNTSATQTVQLMNTGASPLVLQLLGWVGGVAAGFSNTQIQCDYYGILTSLPAGGLTLSPGSSCFFTVQFDPPAASGFSGGFVVEDNAGPGQSNLTSTAVGNSSSVFAQVVSVSGTGVSVGPPPPVTITDPETITVNDTETFPDVTQTIHVTDTPTVRVVTPLTVTANNTTRAYGAANPNFTGTVTGALNGDSFVETFSTTAIASSPVGTYPITPAVTDTNLIFYTVTAVNGTLTITQAGTSAHLSTSANGSVADGTPVVLTADAVSATTGTPTGTVTFFNGVMTLGTATLSQGVATLTINTLPSGHNNITTQYGGDTNFTGSTSAVETVSVNSPDYTISANPPTLTLGAGQSGNTTITVTPEGYIGTVSFSCGNLPSYVTCTFNPINATVTFNSGATAAQTLTLTVVVASTISMLEGSRPVLLAMIAPLGLLGFLPLAGKNRKRLRLYLGIVALALVAAGAITGCTSSSTTSNLPPAGPQAIVVNATANGGIAHSLNLIINITN